MQLTISWTRWAAVLCTIGNRCVRHIIGACASPIAPRMFQQQVVTYLVGDGSAHVVRGTDVVAAARNAAEVHGIASDPIAIARTPSGE